VAKSGGSRWWRARAWVAVLAGLTCSVMPPASSASAHQPGVTAPLQLITKVLQRTVHTPGTAWAVDPLSHQLAVLVDDTVTGERIGRLRSVTHPFGASVRIRHVPGVFRLLMAGGDATLGPGGVRCSLGFNVTRLGQPYFLTAGHCGKAARSWSDAHGAPIGVTEASTYPGHDYALVRYTRNIPHPSVVDLYNGGSQPISHAAEAFTGEVVQRSGMASGLHSGVVIGLDATVNTQQGAVTGLIETDLCAVQGDSGGPLFDGDAAVGITSVGESGDCANGGLSFYQPVTDALRTYGAQIG
jgi:streptogrisin D